VQKTALYERILCLHEAHGMNHKDFQNIQESLRAQSVIGNGRTDPVPEKILVICEVHGFTPYEVLINDACHRKQFINIDSHG